MESSGWRVVGGEKLIGSQLYTDSRQKMHLSEGWIC